MIKNFPHSDGANILFALASEPFIAEDFYGELKPPKHFDSAQFVNYIPEPEYPSQATSLEAVQEFITDLAAKPSKVFGRFWKAKGSDDKSLYLDGGFGVGKTHLLAAAYHVFDGTKAYLSFQELMFLVGLQSLNGVVASFKKFKLLVTDEFELDDPGNMRITTNLLGQLLDIGVSIIASSNTPPGALGEGKFSVTDFKRELGNLTQRFSTLRIDGEDYRLIHHLNEGEGVTWVKSEEDLLRLSQNVSGDGVLNISFQDFLAVLAKVHPMRIRRVVGKLSTVILHNISEISHPHEALRFVYFIDKAYDNDLLLLASSAVEVENIFQRSYFAGGDTKKYLRTISRLKEMTRTGFNRLNT